MGAAFWWKIWTRLGGARTFTASQNFLLSPDGLSTVDDVLVFYMENQNSVCWGVPTVWLRQPDPPVFIDASNGTSDRMSYNGLVQENGSLSEFILQMVILETVIQTGLRCLRYGCRQRCLRYSAGKLFVARPATMALASVPLEFYGGDAHWFGQMAIQKSMI